LENLGLNIGFREKNGAHAIEILHNTTVVAERINPHRGLLKQDTRLQGGFIQIAQYIFSDNSRQNRNNSARRSVFIEYRTLNF
jgi:hypothetical protein